MRYQIEFEPATSNFLDESFANATGKKEARKAKRKARKDLKAVCGRKPLSKKKRADWQKCADEYNANKGSDTASTDDTSKSTDTASAPSTNTPASTTAPATTDAAASTSTSTSTDTTKPDDTKGASATAASTDSGDKGDSGNGGSATTDKDKILGLPKPVFFLGVAVVAIGGFFVVRGMMKGGKSAAVATA
jgi:uncharacterized membrane protein